MQKFKKIGGVLVVVAAVLGFRLYKKNTYQKELRAEVTSLCGSDPACLSAVGAHFEACFDAHYSLGGRHRTGGLKPDEFFGCLNTRSGTNVFTKRPEGANPAPQLAE